jgi:2-polyprenyl-6-methoxyphenol hydroxylase-like FAD-dependent oxidoreductase
MSLPKTGAIVVGGGPVGLYLAGRLLQMGVPCRVLEKKAAPDRHSKSLGIHPVSLELFEKAGIAKSFIQNGLQIKRGIAFWNRKNIGSIRFDNCPEPFNFILALPQWKTETILAQWLHSLDENAFIREADVFDLTEENSAVTVRFTQNGQQHSITGQFLAGCDGKNSFVRNHLNIPFNGRTYPDCYVMGDFVDNTDFGSDAAVYLHRDGLIESFPLPEKQRRWVVKTGHFIEDPAPDVLADRVQNRIGHSLYDSKNVMISAFGVQHFLAETFHSGRMLLAGDAAHVISPIGGQGMNLGWLDAEDCAKTISKALRSSNNYASMFQQYSAERIRIARQVGKRAEMNMYLGRKETPVWLKKSAVYLITGKFFSAYFARIFTMRGLGRWWI